MGDRDAPLQMSSLWSLLDSPSKGHSGGPSELEGFGISVSRFSFVLGEGTGLLPNHIIVEWGGRTPSLRVMIFAHV